MFYIKMLAFLPSCKPSSQPGVQNISSGRSQQAHKPDHCVSSLSGVVLPSESSKVPLCQNHFRHLTVHFSRSVHNSLHNAIQAQSFRMSKSIGSIIVFCNLDKFHPPQVSKDVCGHYACTQMLFPLIGRLILSQ